MTIDQFNRLYRVFQRHPLASLIREPTNFFETARSEDWKPAFKFFMQITIFLSIATPIVNFLGIESDDISSAYQAQIIAYRLVKGYLHPTYGAYSYLIEPFLIIGFGLVILLFLSGFLHLAFRLMGGKGSILNGWKAACYGVGPCIFGGFLPGISLFAAFYSALIQLYLGPKVLYEARESRAIVFFALMLALTFVEMFFAGTTVPEFAK